MIAVVCNGDAINNVIPAHGAESDPAASNLVGAPDKGQAEELGVTRRIFGTDDH